MPKLPRLQRKTRRRREYLRRKEGNVEGQESTDDVNNSGVNVIIDTSSLAGDEVENVTADWDISSVSEDGMSEHIGFSDTDSSTDDDSEEENDAFSELLSEKLYNSCRLSEDDSVSLVSLMSSRFKLSKRATSAILAFAKLHLPKGTPYPSSYYRYEKKLNLDNAWLTKVYFCKKCHQHLSNDLVCCVCKAEYDLTFLNKCACFFLICDIKKQIESILSDKRVCDVLSSNFAKPSGHTFCDIRDGEMYKSIVKDPFDLTLTFNTDGAKCTNSNPPKSIWPFLLTMNELPYRLRKQNVILGALWYDRAKPNMKMFLSPIVSYLTELNKSCVTWEMSNGCKVASHIHFVLSSVDSPARCQMQGLKQFNGYYGCAWCYHPGKMIKRLKGHARIYPVQNFTPALRKDKEFRTSVLNKKWENGIMFESPLVNMPQFDMCWGFSVDYLHCVLLGVVQQLAALWFDPGQEEYKINKQLAEVGRRFGDVKVPKETTRTPREIGPAPIKMKGSEWRTWLFVAPLLLQDIMDSKYLDHFKLLACSIHTLLTPGITVSDIIDAEQDLVKFASDVMVLYGEENCTYNVHQLTHLARCVLNWGPLYESSAFGFESCNGKLASYIHSSQGVLNQIASRHFAELRSRSLELSENDVEVTNFFEETLKTQNIQRAKFALVKPKPVPVNCVPVIQQLAQFCNRPKVVLESKRAYANYHQYSTAACDTTKRSNSAVKVGDKLGIIKQFYEVQCSCEYACACTHLFVLAETFKPSNSCGIHYAFAARKKCKLTLEVIPLNIVELVKFFVVKSTEKVFYVTLPNLIEGD